jgi:hypothetical protein
LVAAKVKHDVVPMSMVVQLAGDGCDCERASSHGSLISGEVATAEAVTIALDPTGLALCPSVTGGRGILLIRDPRAAASEPALGALHSYGRKTCDAEPVVAPVLVDGTAPPLGGAAGGAPVPAGDGTAPPFGGAAGGAPVPAGNGTAPPFGGAAGGAQVPAGDTIETSRSAPHVLSKIEVRHG